MINNGVATAWAKSSHFQSQIDEAERMTDETLETIEDVYTSILASLADSLDTAISTGDRVHDNVSDSLVAGLERDVGKAASLATNAARGLQQGIDAKISELEIRSNISGLNDLLLRFTPPIGGEVLHPRFLPGNDPSPPPEPPLGGPPAIPIVPVEPPLVPPVEPPEAPPIAPPGSLPSPPGGACPPPIVHVKCPDCNCNVPVNVAPQLPKGSSIASSPGSPVDVEQNISVTDLDPTALENPLAFIFYNRGEPWKAAAVEWAGPAVSGFFNSSDLGDYAEKTGNVLEELARSYEEEEK